jgi:hypothetical protein
MPMLPVMPVTLTIDTIDLSFESEKNLFATNVLKPKAIKQISMYIKGTFIMLIFIFSVSNPQNERTGSKK